MVPALATAETRSDVGDRHPVRESLPSWRKLEMVCEVEGFAVTTDPGHRRSSRAVAPMERVHDELLGG